MSDRYRTRLPDDIPEDGIPLVPLPQDQGRERLQKNGNSKNPGGWNHAHELPAAEPSAEPSIPSQPLATPQPMADHNMPAPPPPELIQNPADLMPPPPPELFQAANGQAPSLPPMDFEPSDSPMDLALPPVPGMTQGFAAAQDDLTQPEPQTSETSEAPNKPGAIIAMRGALRMPMVHSIMSLNMRPDVDEIAPALAMFDGLAEGEHAFIRFSLRPSPPDTRSTLQEMLNMIVGGESMSSIQNPSTANKLRRWVNWVMNWASFLVSQDKKAESPNSPRSAYRPTKQRPAYQRSEEEAAARKFAQEKVQGGAYFDATLYIGAIGKDERADALQELVGHIVEHFSASYSNIATGQGWDWDSTDPLDAAYGLMAVKQDYNTILGPHELGEMMKLPDQQTSVSSAVKIDFGKMVVRPQSPIIIADPLNPPKDIIPIGEIDVGTSRQQAIGMPIQGLYTHAYICGSTGSGKSTLSEWLMYGLAKNGESLFCVDPHGELVDHTLENILAFAPERKDDIVVLDFGDTEWPIAFNPLSISSHSQIESTVNAVRDMILKMLNLNPDSAPRAVNYTEQAVWALCEANLRGLDSHPNLHLTLLQVPLFFTDAEFRRQVMAFCTNLAISETFGKDGPFEKLGERQQLDHVMPILRTFSSLSTKDSFGNVFGQSESKIDFAKWVRERKIVMMKLPAITGGDSAVAKFIGAMVTPMLIGSLPSWGHDKSLSAYLIIDEFQNYATESFKDLLAQTRKYGLYAIAANQVPQDLPQDVLRGIQSNTQTKFCFRLDAQASRMIADFIASGAKYPTTDDIISMDNWWAWANVSMGQTQSGPFVIKGLAPPLSPGYSYLTDEVKAAAEEKKEELLAQVLNNSRLASSVQRDIATKAREHHVREALTVMSQKITDRMNKGGWEGTGMRPEEEAWDSANWDWNA